MQASVPISVSATSAPEKPFLTERLTSDPVKLTQGESAKLTQSEALAQIEANHQEINRLYRESYALAAGAGLLPKGTMSAEEVSISILNKFQFGAIPKNDIIRAMTYNGEKSGDGIPACLSLHEGRFVYAVRMILHAGFGSVLVKAHEKKQAELAVSFNSRFLP